MVARANRSGMPRPIRSWRCRATETMARGKALSVDDTCLSNPELSNEERTTHQPFRRGALRLLDGPNPAIEQLLRVLHIDTTTGHPSGSTLGESVISSILHQIILQSGMILAKPTAHLSRSELRKVYELIENDIGSSLTLERLAASIGFSVRHLCRNFRASSGLSVHRYIVSRRIERAKALINKSELGFEEIAEAVGFAHHAHMTATFRRLIGATPAQFRGRPMSRGVLELEGRVTTAKCSRDRS